MMHLMTKIYKQVVVRIILLTAIIPTARIAKAGEKDPITTFHFQQTVVTQMHPGFSAKYTGSHSLNTKSEIQTSLTTTLFSGIRIGKNTSIYFNPEIAGGAGISRATGVAGFPNGETFRIGNPAPQIYVARLLMEQYIPLSKETRKREDGVNQLAGNIPNQYIRLVAGRFAISDYFDNNSVSHDPRTQFLNWSLMSNGAYDYAANTRGYTYGGVIELATKIATIRFGAAMVPTKANQSVMDGNISKSHSYNLEIEKSWGPENRKGVIRILAFQNNARMGNYTQAILMSSTPVIDSTSQLGRTKYGFGVNIEKQLSDLVTLFARASWNDGKNETWMFTEIDQSISTGISGNGSNWKRINDVWGVAAVMNGISKEHQNYLSAGGSGFMVGDGKLNYGREFILELFYNAEVHDQHFFVTPDYQFIMNPAYNKDRGPVSVFALRVQSKF